MMGSGIRFASAVFLMLLAAACASSPQRENGLEVAAMVALPAPLAGPQTQTGSSLRVNGPVYRGSGAPVDEALTEKFGEALRLSLRNAGYEVDAAGPVPAILDLSLDDLTVFDVTGRTTAVLVVSYAVHDVAGRQFCARKEAVTTFISVATKTGKETTAAVAGGVVAGILVGVLTQSPEAGAAAGGTAAAVNPGLWQRAPGVAHLARHQEPGPLNREDRALHASEGVIRHAIGQLVLALHSPHCRPPATPGTQAR